MGYNMAGYSVLGAENEVSSRAVFITWAQSPFLSLLVVDRIHFLAAVGLRSLFFPPIC